MIHHVYYKLKRINNDTLHVDTGKVPINSIYPQSYHYALRGQISKFPTSPLS